MAKLFSFTICDSLSNMPAAAGSVPMLIAPQIALRPQFIPGNYSFGVAIGISGVNLKEPNKMKFIIKSPDGTTVYDSGENELPVVTKSDSLPAENQGFIMCIDVRNLVFLSEGEYTFSLFLNGENIADKSVPVYKKVE